MSDDSADDKKRLRAAFLPLLRALSEDRAEQVGLAVTRRLERWSRWHQSSEVALYASLPGEVDSAPLFESARGSGRVTLLPRMRPGTQLEFVPIEGFEALRRGRYGVREPDEAVAARALEPGALVLVPGLAFDRRGGRLGRGGGYYDRALARLGGGAERPLLVGVAFDFQRVERVPMSGHDVFVDAVVSEEGLFLAGEESDAGGGSIGAQEQAEDGEE
ncbi:MAG: 5-formyltetrahydrofolate cyclo-ligase [bacterium]